MICHLVFAIFISFKLKLLTEAKRMEAEGVYVWVWVLVCL